MTTDRRDFTAHYDRDGIWISTGRGCALITVDEAERLRDALNVAIERAVARTTRTAA